MKLHVKANVRNAAKPKKVSEAPMFIRVDMLQGWRKKLKESVEKICGCPVDASEYTDESSTGWTVVIHNSKKLSLEAFEDKLRRMLVNSSDEGPGEDFGGSFGGWMKVSPFTFDESED